MGLFRKKQEDRSYSIKLRRTSYAKLGLLSERLKTSETDTIDGIIDFALANFFTSPKNTGGNIDLASIITGEEAGDSDLVNQLVAAFLPKLLAGGIGSPNPAGSTSGNQSSDSSESVDVSEALKKLGL